MTTRKQTKNEETYLSAGTDMFLFSLKKYILPSIIKYYATEYNVTFNVTVEELAERALNVELPVEEKDTATPTKEAIRKPKQVDVIGGCQYILERSRVREGQACGDKRDVGGHFCKHCQKKRSFPPKARAYAEKLGLTFEDVIGENYVPIEEKKPHVPVKRGAKAKEPAKRGPKAKVPLSKPGYKSKVFKESEDEEDDSIVAEEDLHIESEPIEGLKGILYELRSNIVFWMSDDGSNDIVAIGQWTEDNKISRLTEALKITAKQYEMKIGRYEDYDLGKYSINYVEPKEPKKGMKREVKKEDNNDDEDEDNNDDEDEDNNDEDEDEGEDEDEDEGEIKPNGNIKPVTKTEPERLKPDERLHAIPNRRTIRHK